MLHHQQYHQLCYVQLSEITQNSTGLPTANREVALETHSGVVVLAAAGWHRWGMLGHLCPAGNILLYVTEKMGGEKHFYSWKWMAMLLVVFVGWRWGAGLSSEMRRYDIVVPVQSHIVNSGNVLILEYEMY